MKSLPVLGAGLSFTPELINLLRRHFDDVSVLELVADNFLETGTRRSNEYYDDIRRFPLILHGLATSIASVGLDLKYVAKIKHLVRETKSPWFSDHLAYTRVGKKVIPDFIPSPFSKEALRVVSNNLKMLHTQINAPVLVENISYTVPFPGNEMSEAEFLSLVVKESGCGLLMDLNNLHANSINNDYDAYEFLEQIPIQNIVEIHVAGGRWESGVYFDTHDSPVPGEVWRLLRFAIDRVAPNAIILERDANFNNVSDIIKDLKRARQVFTASVP